MVLQLILRYLANNEQLIQRLADSYPLRRAAQMVLSAYYRTRSVAEQQKLVGMTPERLQQALRSFKSNVQKEIENAKNDLAKKK
ncbi:protein NCBP2AS2 homolog [Anopheles stephensi]|uniref:protein NCBP2AS2 homolog n=1 Tax=Anopheles stephensi TaxID=30069 RepID=UPI0016588C0B|nr:protein NCBP2AS2 homolog [Anopheles stephensi]